MSINGSASCIAMDWVSRTIYWAQREVSPTEINVVYRAQIGLPNTRPKINRLFTTENTIYNLQILPFSRCVFHILYFTIHQLCLKRMPFNYFVQFSDLSFGMKKIFTQG